MEARDCSISAGSLNTRQVSSFSLGLLCLEQTRFSTSRAAASPAVRTVDHITG